MEVVGVAAAENLALAAAATVSALCFKKSRRSIQTSSKE
jgi:hypothetical protein